MGAHFHDDHPHHHHHGSLGRVGTIALCVVVGSLLLAYAFGWVDSFFGVDVALLLTAVAGYPLLRQSLQDLFAGHLSSHVTIAIAAAAAVAIGEYFAAAEVAFIMLVGEAIEHWTVDRSKAAIAGFVASQPDTARVIRDGEEVVVTPVEVEVGEIVRVLAGERVPVDGFVTSGSSAVDHSSITGEPLPVPITSGDSVWSGGVNQDGVLEVRTERAGGTTTLARIATLIEEAQARRARVVRAADRLARYFLPAVLVASGLIYLLTGEMLRTVAALIVACPCALVLATPAAMAAAIARLAREGVLVKGGDVVESLAAVQCCALDKTGTLTMGRPVLTRIVPASPEVAEDEVLRMAASAEQHSEHLLGQAVVRAAQERRLEIDPPRDVTVLAGRGIEATVRGERVAVGRASLIEDEWTPVAAPAFEGSQVFVGKSGKLLGTLSFTDELRPDAREGVELLRANGIRPVVMLTGDAESEARAKADAANVDEFRAGLLPEEKVREVEALEERHGGALMVGDGINDAPSLAAASVGVALGRGASDLSAEAAQVVLLGSKMTSLAPLVEYSRRVVARIRSSILIFAFGINFVAVGFAGFGWLSPAAAAVTHQAASLLVILNCVRLLYEGRAVQPRAQAPALRRLWAGATAAAAKSLRPWRSTRDQLAHDLEHRLDDLLASARRAALSGVAALGALRSLRGWHVLVAVLTLWLAWGIRTVSLDQVAVRVTLGRAHEALAGPGLTWHPRWPVGKLVRVEPQRLRSVAIGTPWLGATDARWEAPHGLSGSPRPDATRDEREDRLLLTGDENLVELGARVLYVVDDPRRYVQTARSPKEVLESVARSVLREVVASRPLDDALVARRELEEVLESGVARRLESLELGVEVRGALIVDAHPPLEVVAAFRDTSSALEELGTLVLEAEGYARSEVPRARGRAAATSSRARAEVARVVERANGEARRFTLRQPLLARDRALHRFRLEVETLEEVLQGREKFVVAPDIGRQRLRFGPDTLRFGVAEGSVSRPSPQPLRPPEDVP